MKEATKKKVEVSESPKEKRLLRSKKDRILGGVCAGLAEYFGIDPIIVRLITAVAVIYGGTGVLLYVILWVIIPEAGDEGMTTQEVVKRNSKEIEQKVESMAKGVDNNNTKLWLGVLVIFFGSFMLLSTLGITTYLNLGWVFSKLWPLFLIVLGILILVKSNDGKK